MVDKLNAAPKASLKHPDFQRREADLGAVVVNDERTSREAHKRFVAQETQCWAPILKGVVTDSE